MAETTFIVDRVTSLEPMPYGGRAPADNNPGRLVVTLDSGKQATIEPPRAKRWMSTFRSLMATKRRVSLQVDTATGDVVALRLPVVTRVRTLQDYGEGRYALSLLYEPVDYQLRVSTERERRLIDTLQACGAEQDVVFTLSRARGVILDAFALGGPVVPLALEPLPPADHLLFQLQPVTLADIAPIFQSLKEQDCPHSPVEPSDTCIPLRYPDRFCNTIASVVCHMLEARGLPALKLWLRGGMDLFTNNHPCCRVPWNTHVAALIRLAKPSGHTELAVLDHTASLTEPIPRAKWQAGLARSPQSPPIAIPSPIDTYWLYSETNYLKERDDSVSDDLIALREEYGMKIAERGGPPPYACD